ncbi:hypothetical protein FACS189472_17360 [Alphaproteobacteria bacterium]|nr:hypothetical protein FACS189472_17360 [Alphaproteobacteria bacterium]
MGNVNTGLSAANFVVSHASDAADVATKIGIGVPSAVSKVAGAASEFGKAAGAILSGVGAVTSGLVWDSILQTLKRREK